MSKTAVIYRHLAFEDAGLLGKALIERGYELDYRDVGVDSLEGGIEADLLVILGGPIGVNDVADYPYLKDEMDIIRHRTGQTIGICLGAQLGAVALGGSVAPGHEMELGWSELITESKHPFATILASRPVLHWHKDLINVDGIHGAEVLVSTGPCPVQAFIAGPFLGLQFHIEADPATFERWLIGHADTLRDNNIDIMDLRGSTALYGKGAEESLVELLNSWLPS
ncbi:MAG: glutamine amidotransferase [Corynebacterium sp.]|nr:glutamine amidotransferase [Corynebacterium sp.]